MSVGINIYTENGKPVCRVHETLFKQKIDCDDMIMLVPRFYCDGIGKVYERGDPLDGIGFEYQNPDDPITDWFDTEEEAIAEWKRLRKCS